MRTQKGCYFSEKFIDLNKLNNDKHGKLMFQYRVIYIYSNDVCSLWNIGAKKTVKETVSDGKREASLTENE